MLYKQNRPGRGDRRARPAAGRRTPRRSQNLKAAALGRIGSYEEAIAIYEAVLARFPDQPKVWMSYGHVLKTVGRQADSIAAYRRAIGIAPGARRGLVEPRQSEDRARSATADIAAMEARARRRRASASEDRFHLHFALGKALEDRGEAEAAFGHYAEGNRLRRAAIDYDPDEIADHVAPQHRLVHAGLLRRARGPGLPRARPDLHPRHAARRLDPDRADPRQPSRRSKARWSCPTSRRWPSGSAARKLRSDASAYPECLAELDADALRALGEEYLERTRVQRKTGRPFFIDKMPNNWAHVGLIRLILPNAKIIDARRHPLACCFSNFKQHFARGQGFTYDLAELGRYYRDYVDADGAISTRSCPAASTA